jgi:hypothetical protein
MIANARRQSPSGDRRCLSARSSRATRLEADEAVYKMKRLGIAPPADVSQLSRNRDIFHDHKN